MLSLSAFVLLASYPFFAPRPLSAPLPSFSLLYRLPPSLFVLSLSAFVLLASYPDQLSIGRILSSLFLPCSEIERMFDSFSDFGPSSLQRALLSN